MATPAPALRIRLNTGEVIITFTPAVASQRVLLGKTPDEALRLVGLIHNLCAQAHRAACAAACGMTADADSAPAVMLEILREHLVVLCRSAPPLLGLEVPNLPVAISRIGTALAPQETTLREALWAALFGSSEQAPFSFRNVIRHSVLAPFFVALAEREAGAGLEGMSIALPADPTFYPRVAQDDGFDRLAGIGPLFERLLARLFEVHRLMSAFGTPAQDAYAPALIAPGVARVAAARGALTHRATLVEGMVASYAIETPTADMLRSNGPLEIFLSALAEAPGADEAIIRLGLLAFDPCVAHEVTCSPTPERTLADA